MENLSDKLEDVIQAETYGFFPTDAKNELWTVSLPFVTSGLHEDAQRGITLWKGMHPDIADGPLRLIHAPLSLAKVSEL